MRKCQIRLVTLAAIALLVNSCGGGGPAKPPQFENLMKQSSAALSARDFETAKKQGMQALGDAEAARNADCVFQAIDLLVQIESQRQNAAAVEPLLLRGVEFARNNNIGGMALYKRCLAVADFYEHNEQVAKAEPYLETATEIWVKSYDDKDIALAGIKKRAGGPPRTDRLYLRLATAYEANGRYPKAEELRRKTLAILRQQYGDQAVIDTIDATNSLADNLVEQGKYPEAEKLYNESISMSTRDIKPEWFKQWPNKDEMVQQEKDKRSARELAALAEMYRRQERYSDAEPLFKKAIEHRIGAYVGPGHSPQDLKCRVNYAKLLRSTNRSAEADEIDTYVRTNWEDIKKRPGNYGVIRADAPQSK